MTSSIQIKMLYFAQVRDITQIPNEVLEIKQNSSTKDLLTLLYNKYPKLKDEKNLSISINCLISNSDIVLRNLDEVALLPPISGG
ncbi:MoaD/ThiS family protein [Candidatus Nitrosocosmicus sp. SS]|uniref:MoaD/ThiS family protein n=1 Tax=Candidatus Nitrosocosmicus agrestis TaxID=2563600 RepID=UPI001331A4B6|nr:MoaD/ThiS family protein [Candidatus Nitrosocosmicus sp. SS]